MRTSFLLLLAAAFALAACDDTAETTGPGAASIATPAATVATALPPGPSDARKAAAFTAVTVVESAGAFNFAGVGSLFGGMSWGIVPQFCPAGTKVIGGGYEIGGANPLDLKVLASKPVGNAWQVSVEETGSSLSTATLKVTAICIA